MKAALIAILLAGLVAPADARPVPQDRNKKKKQEEQLKKRIKVFKSRMRKHFSNPDKRVEAVRDLNQPLNAGILDALAKPLEKDVSPRVKQEVLRVLADYATEAKAADAIGKLIKNYNRRRGVTPPVLRTALVSFSRMRPKLSRPYVKSVNKLIDYKDVDVSQAAIEALGYIRHRDSMRPLIGQLLAHQKSIKGIIDTTSKSCDGG